MESRPELPETSWGWPPLAQLQVLVGASVRRPSVRWPLTVRLLAVGPPSHSPPPGILFADLSWEVALDCPSSLGNSLGNHR